MGTSHKILTRIRFGILPSVQTNDSAQGTWKIASSERVLADAKLPGLARFCRGAGGLPQAELPKRITSLVDPALQWNGTASGKAG